MFHVPQHETSEETPRQWAERIWSDRHWNELRAVCLLENLPQIKSDQHLKWLLGEEPWPENLKVKPRRAHKQRWAPKTCRCCSNSWLDGAAVEELYPASVKPKKPAENTRMTAHRKRRQFAIGVLVRRRRTFAAGIIAPQLLTDSTRMV